MERQSATAHEADCAAYTARTAESRALFERASRVLMGGTTRTSVYYPPYPACMVRGEGCRMYDADGNCYVDFLSNYTVLLHGHSFPPIVEALKRQAEQGVCFSAPSEREIELAEILCERVDSVDKLRFASSGTEAVMYAIRLAHAFTGRNMIAKFEGGFHGAYDDCQISHSLSAELIETSEVPIKTANTEGLPSGVAERVVILPFNRQAEACALIEAHADQLACVILEPVLGAGGVIPAEQSFLAALRKTTEKAGIQLIFDEIMSFRLGYGGAQQVYGVAPDLTTFGKIISGGLPLAAFGGREEVMELLDPRNGPPPIPQSGTFNGSAIAAAAGVACMEHLTHESLAALEAIGLDMKAQLQAVFAKTGTAAQVNGFGSLFNIHFSAEPVVDHRGTVGADREKLARLSMALLLRGYFMAPRGMICLSTALGPAEIEGFASAVEDALESGEV